MTQPLVDAADTSGLTTAEARSRRDRGLSNRLPDDSGRSLARIVFSNAFTVFNGIVGGAFVLLIALGAWQDAVFGFFVVANTAIGVVQEFRAGRTLARLTVLNAPRALVRRDGEDRESAIADVVLGDLLVLRPGEQLSDDARVVHERDLEIDESLVTGESDPVMAPVGRELLSGSTVAAGSGLARVIRVGDDSYAARITREARRFTLVDSELRRSIGRVIRWISIGLLPIGAIVVNGQMQAAGGWGPAIADGSWRDAGVASVASIVAMVPAGLVFMTSIALAVGAVRLAHGGVLVRELAAVEGLARVDLLCIDKTGTLTEGTMSLARVEAVDRPPAGWQSALATLAADPVANATSRAIGADYRDVRRTPDAAVAFSSRHKWSAVSFAAGASPGSWVLGGADVVLAGAHESGTRIVRDATLSAAAGRRTLVLAHSPEPMPARADPRAPHLPPGLQPVAVLVFRERVRADARATIRYFAEQGVEVCIISGDDPRTVAAVAQQVGLTSRGDGASDGDGAVSVAVDGRQLPTTPHELADALRTQRAFGRVTPQQKRDMVRAFHELGHTVAMVGDGVNDALALKAADLGIAMGSGSPATRSVAHLVLLDGELARLPAVVAEGRRVIGNVERLAKLFLSKTVYAVVLAVTFGLLLWPFPFLPRQLAIVDGLTIGLPALVLALLPNTRISRAGFLARAGRFCVPAGLTVAGAVVAGVAAATAHPDVTAGQVQTVAVVTLTLSALGVLVLLARPFTGITASVVVGGYLGLGAVLAVPPARDFLQLQVLPLELLVVAVVPAAVAGVVVYVVHRLTAARD